MSAVIWIFNVTTIFNILQCNLLTFLLSLHITTYMTIDLKMDNTTYPEIDIISNNLTIFLPEDLISIVIDYTLFS